MILKGLFLLILSRMGESEIKVLDTDEERCNFRCELSRGEFCLGSRCVQCSYCPDNPFDVDQRGRLYVYRPCIRHGFCPKICSSYLALGNNPSANETLCQRIRKQKVTKPPKTQPVPTTVYETTTSGSPNDAILMTSGTTYIGTSPVVQTTHLTEGSTPNFIVLGLIIAVGVIFLAVVAYASVKLCRKFECWYKPVSSTGNPTEKTELFDRTSYKLLEIQLDHQNKTATVKGLQVLNCNALQLCACLYNPDRPAQNWMLTGGVDEIQLPGVMLPHKVYTVKAGRATREEFQCIAEGKVNTEEFVNVTLDEVCSTTLKDIFENIRLRRSLESELCCPSQRDMTVIISIALELTEDEGKCFKGHRSLGKLYDETLTGNDLVDMQIHILMENLAPYNEAKDFVRKIAKREPKRDVKKETKRYCKKCLELLHRMCCGNSDDISEVVNETQV